MKKINIRKIIYHIRHKYLTLNNAVILVAFLIAASWVWGSLGMMERNYSLQRDVDAKKRELRLTELQRDTLAFENRFVTTAEYQELAVRESLGLVRPGEKVLILPDNVAKADRVEAAPLPVATQPSNIEQWVNFLFGGNSKSLSE